MPRLLKATSSRRRDRLGPVTLAPAILLADPDSQFRFTVPPGDMVELQVADQAAPVVLHRE